MPGVPSSPADGPRPHRPDVVDQTRHGDGDPHRSDDDGAAGHRDDWDPAEAAAGEYAHDVLDAARLATLPRRLWTSVVFAAFQTWLLLGLALLVLGGVGAPVPPAVTDARSIVPWAPQDAWSVAADAGWVLVVSLAAAALLRRRLWRRGMRPLPATADVTVVVSASLLVAMVVWPGVFRDLSPGATAVGAMLLTILLLRLREVVLGRDLLGRWDGRRGSVTLVVSLLLVASYAAWHPLLVGSVDVRTAASASVIGGNTSTDDGGSTGGDGGDPQETSTSGDPVRIETGPRGAVRLSFDVQGATGTVRLLEARPVLPRGAFRLLPAPRNPDGSPVDGTPLPIRLRRGDSLDRVFRLRAGGACARGEQRIERLFVRYRRLGRTISTVLALDTSVTLSCRSRG